MRFRIQGVTFGGDTDTVGVVAFTAPTTELRTDDIERLNRDGILPGRDWLGSASWQITARTDVNDLTTALAAAERLERAWKKPAVRTGTALGALDYSLDEGATWFRVQGRARKFQGVVPDRLAIQGRGDLDLEFVQLDPAHYSATEHQVVIPAVPASIGGLVSPLVSPLTTVASGEDRAGSIDNAGDLPSPARVVFRGPSTNPQVTTDRGFSLTYLGTLAYDQTVTLSGWDQSVTMNPGAKAVQGNLSRATRLSRVVVPAGHSEWYYRATDPTGTSSATVYWRDAYTAMQA